MKLFAAAGLAALALGGALGGCTVVSAEGTTATQTAAKRADWASFRDGFIEGWFKQDPANAVYQGGTISTAA